MAAAHDWGLRPSALGLCAPEDDLTVMATYTRAQGEMLAWAMDQAEKKRKKPGGKRR